MNAVTLTSAAKAAACAFLAIGVLGAERVDAQTPDPAAVEAFLDGYVAAHMADDYPPGVIIAVAARDSAFVKAYGVADYDTGEPATTDTLFRIASISKTFVWTAVMILVDEGVLDLDADVNGYLKNIRLPDAFGAPVTLNHLMAHRAGFEDTLGDFFESNSGRSMEESLIRHMPKRVAPPGFRTSYSNWGTSLAAQVVEDVTGEDPADFIRARILDPLAMDSTTLRDPASVTASPLNPTALDARLASPHRLKEGAPETMGHDAVEPTWPAGAAAISARDAARWLQFFLRGGRYETEAGEERMLSPEAFAIMRRRAFPDRPMAPDFAHGFMETEIAGYGTFGHGGTLSGFIADMRVAPALGLGVFVVVNGAETTRVADEISRAVIEYFAGADLYAAPWTEKASPETVAAAKELEGVYLGNRRLHSKFEKIAALGAELVVTAKDDGSLVVAGGGVVKRYYPVAPDVWTDRRRDRLFAYRDPDGTVARLSSGMGTNSYERVSFLRSSSGFYAGVGAALFFSLVVLLSAWRRQGRPVRTTPAGRLLALAQGGAALAWLTFAVALGAALAFLSALTLTDLVEIGWPPRALVVVGVAAWAAALGAVFSALMLAPVWTISGWSLWRKLHHVLFAAAGLFGLYALYEWRLILAPMTTV